MKFILIIISIFSVIQIKAQEKQLLIDTVFIKTFSNEKIIKSLKESKKQYKKYYQDSGSYVANLSLTVDNEAISDFKSPDFTFDYFRTKKYKKNTKNSFYKDIKIFEFSPERSEYTLNSLYNYLNFNYLNNFKNFTYKMREVDGMLQITCYSKSTNFKSVIVLDSKTYLPKAIYQSPIAPTYNVSQTFNNIMKDTDSETIYNLIKNEATVIYKMDNNKITIAEIDADLLMDNYRIRRTNKKGDLIFSKDLINIVSKVNLIKNDKVHQ